MHFRSGFNPFRKFSFNLFIDEENVDDGTTGKDKEEKKVEKKEGDDDEPSAEELEELARARDFVKILRDPAARKSFIAQLAKQEGITEDSSEKEKKSAVRNIKSIVKKHLGPEYEGILGDKLEGLLTEFSDLIDEERIKPVREGFTKSESSRLQAEAVKGYDEAFAEFSNAKDLDKAVDKLTNEIRPSEGQTAKSYFRRLLIIAAEEKGIKLTKKDSKSSSVANFNADRRNANRKDASSRLASEGADDGKVERKAPKDMTVDEAIAQAAKEAEALLKG